MLSLTTEQAALVLLIAAFLSHGLLLLNDGYYWDGWILRGWQVTKDWVTMRRWFGELGMPQLYYMHRAMTFLPSPVFAYKLVGFLSVYFSALCVYLLGLQFGGLTPFEALCVAALMLCYPGLQMLVELCISLNYMLPVAAFLCASWLSLSGETVPDVFHWLYRGGALLLFLFSFNMNSLLMYYGGFMLFSLVYQVNSRGLGFQSGGWFLVSHLDYLVLPLIYWWAKERFTPRHGQASTYNRLEITKLKTITGFAQAWHLAIWGVFNDAFRYIRVRPIAMLACVGLSLTVWFLKGEIVMMAPPKAIGVITFGLICFVFAVLPYAWVGQPFWRRGWATKNNILLALPVAICLIGSCNLLFNPTSLVLVLGLLFSASVLYLNYIYLCWLAVWAKNRSFLLNLGRIPEARTTSIFAVSDLHPIQGSSHNGGAPAEHFAPYLVYMFSCLYGETRRLGIYEPRNQRTLPYRPDEVSAAIAGTTLDFGMTGIDINGSQARVIIKQGLKKFSEVQTGWRYLVCRLFHPSRLDQFLIELTELEFQPLIDPNSVAARQAAFASMIATAKANVEEGRWSEAFILLLEAVTMHPEQADLYGSIGFCLLNLNRLDEAVAYFKKVVEMQPNAESALALGIASSMCGKWDVAEKAYNQVLTFAPGDMDASRSLGELYLNQQRFDEASALFSEMLTQHPGDVCTLLLLADSSLRNGDAAKAREIFQEVLTLDANNVQAGEAIVRLG